MLAPPYKRLALMHNLLVYQLKKDEIEVDTEPFQCGLRSFQKKQPENTNSASAVWEQSPSDILLKGKQKHKGLYFVCHRATSLPISEL